MFSRSSLSGSKLLSRFSPRRTSEPTDSSSDVATRPPTIPWNTARTDRNKFTSEDLPATHGVEPAPDVAVHSSRTESTPDPSSQSSTITTSGSAIQLARAESTSNVADVARTAELTSDRASRPVRTRPIQQLTIDPISENEIRLISLAPAASLYETIECALTHHRRDEDIRYAAVSYTWGDSTSTSAIICNGYHMEVPANTAAALRTLRHSAEVEVLWIDAVCINQADVRERSQQVAQMGDVFRRAYRTYAFLGDSASLLGEESDDEVWKQLLAHAWFSRTWVIQEVILSKQIILALGDQKVPLFEVLQQCELRKIGLPKLLELRSEFVHDYAGRPPKSWDAAADDDDDDVLKAVSGTYTNAHVLSRAGPSWSQDIKRRPPSTPDQDQRHSVKTAGNPNLNYWRLPKLLVETKNFRAKDARDKLYALLPLFCKPIPQLLYPDYGKSTEDVYTDLSRYLLQEDMPLSLSHAGWRENSEMPSWTTDWTKATALTELAASPWDRARWRAGYQEGQREISPLFLGPNKQVLVLRGIMLGSVDVVKYHRRYEIGLYDTSGFCNVCSLQLKREKTEDIQLQWISDNNMKTGAIAKRLFSQIGAKTEDLETTIIAYVGKTHSKGLQGPIELIESWLDDFGSSTDRSRSWFDSSGRHRNFIKLARVRHVIDTTTFDVRKIREREEERDVCSGHSKALVAEGDHVCILIGFATPFLIEPHGKQWKLLGKCALDHGGKPVMYGSVVDGLEWSRVWKNPPEHPLQDFEFI